MNKYIKIIQKSYGNERNGYVNCELGNREAVYLLSRRSYKIAPNDESVLKI